MLFDPNLARRRTLQLPNGGDLLQFIDGPLASAECIGPVLCARDNQDDILPDRDLAVPVNDQQFQNIEILQCPLADLPQLLLGHALVMLEGDSVDVASLRMVPRRPKKYGNAADPLRTASHAIDLRVDGEVFALHANQQIIMVGCTHSISPSRPW